MHRLAIRALASGILLALAVTAAWAGSDQRKGTSGAGELLIPVGPQGTALGGTNTGDVQGIESTFWNPAGLATLEGTEVLFSHTSYIADMKVNYAAVATKVGGLGTLGLSAKVLSVGDIQVTTEAAPDGTGEVIQPTFTVMGLTWARQFTDRVRFGTTVNLVSEHILDDAATGVAFDFGVQYDTGWRGLRFGMAMKNFGPSMSFTGSNFDQAVQVPGADPSAANRVLRFSSAPFEMPSFFSIGATYDAYRMGHNSVQFLGSFQNNNFVGDNFAAGAQWRHGDLLALRGSWYGTLTTSTDPTNGNENVSFTTGDDVYSGYALGIGTIVPAGGSKLGIDVTWKPVKNYFDDTVEVGLRMSF
jgi:hypothetical protein